jgi:hypothetical protein
MKSVKFEVKNPQFLEFYSVEELSGLLENTSDETIQEAFLVSTSIYDTEGVEVTDNYKIMEDGIQDTGFGAGKAELFLLYYFIAIIIGLGIILTRYFLT